MTAGAIVNVLVVLLKDIVLSVLFEKPIGSNVSVMPTILRMRLAKLSDAKSSPIVTTYWVPSSFKVNNLPSA